MELSRPVVVKRMPEKVNQREARKFLADVQPFLNADRPQLVFDLSAVRQLDAAGVEMLLHCVSEVMKRDGDLKLASPASCRTRCVRFRCSNSRWLRRGWRLNDAPARRAEFL